MSVLTCEQWWLGWLDWDAVWGGEWGRARYGCIRFWWWSSKGKGPFGGEYNAEMAYWSIIDLCVKIWQYFPYAECIVEFCEGLAFLWYSQVQDRIGGWREIQVQKRNKTDATWRYARAVNSCGRQTFCCGTAYSGIWTHMPIPESSRILLG